MRNSKLGATVVAGRIIRGFAVLAAVTAIGFALPAEAKKDKRDAKPVEDGIPDIANGEPMTLIVSLSSQKVDIYRGTTLVTTSAVSTGQAAFPTKAGVFTILEKQRYHHSNIYSGAPMPWMNRITWSGTALHAGIVPGYPASHGCIRLPYSFAPKLFKISTVGEHVIVAKGRPIPEIIEHPALFQPRPLPSAPEIAKEPAPERHTYLSSGSKLAAAVTAPIVLAKAEMPNTATDGPNEAGSGAPVLDDHATTEEEEPDPDRIHAITPAPATATGHALGEPADQQSHAAPVGSAAVTTDIPDTVPPAEPPIVSPPLAEAPEVKAEPAPAPQAVLPEAQPVAAVVEVKAEPAPQPEVLPEPSPVAPALEAKAEPAPAPQAALAPEPTMTPASLKPLTSAELTIDHGMKAAAIQAAEPRSEAPLRVLITRRTNSDRIIGVQQNLASMGYLEPQNFDGTIGRATITAIKAFQKANGMAETGSFNDELVKKVYEVAGKGEPPAGHLWVRQEFGRVFDAPVSFKNPDEPLGTYVYTALKFAPGETSTKWMAIAVQEAPTNPLDRIEISDDIRQRISERLTPGSSLIVADTAINTAGLTKGADFLVWAKDLPKSNVTAASFTTEEAKPRVKKRYRTTARRYTPIPFQRQQQQLWFGRGW